MGLGAGLSYLEWIRSRYFSLGCSPSGNLLELKPVGLHLWWKRNISPKGAVLILLSAFFVWVGIFLFWQWVFVWLGVFFHPGEGKWQGEVTPSFLQSPGACCQAGGAEARCPRRTSAAQMGAGSAEPAPLSVPRNHTHCELPTAHGWQSTPETHTHPAQATGHREKVSFLSASLTAE